jgi:hypothetical protein
VKLATAPTSVAAGAEGGQQGAGLEGVEGEPDASSAAHRRQEGHLGAAFSAASPRTMAWSTATCTPGPPSASPSSGSSSASAARRATGTGLDLPLAPAGQVAQAPEQQHPRHLSPGRRHVAGHGRGGAGDLEVVALRLGVDGRGSPRSSSASSAPARITARRSAASSWPRQVCSVPVQVSRTRLQASQKLWLSGVMKPSRPPVSATST